MRIVQPSFEEIKETSLFKKIELAGRTCYKSENLITETSGIDFAKRIMSYNHGSVLEHAYLVFKVNEDHYKEVYNKHYQFFAFSNITYPIISFNFRAIYNLYLTNNDKCLIPFFAFLEKKYPELFVSKFDSDISVTLLTKNEIMSLSEEEKDLHLSITVKLVTERGVTHQLVRHRLCSFAQESTRYCNYAKDKFSHEITFIEPYGLNEVTRKYWEEAMLVSEKTYFAMLDNGSHAEIARSVLPTCLKTEIVVTTTLKEWKLIFDLRCHSTAQSEIRFLMTDVRDYFKENKYL